MQAKLEIQVPVVLYTKDSKGHAWNVGLRALGVRIFETDTMTREWLFRDLYSMCQKDNVKDAHFVCGKNEKRRLSSSFTLDTQLFLFSVRKYFTEGMLLPVLAIEVADLVKCKPQSLRPHHSIYEFGLVVAPPDTASTPQLFESDWLSLCTTPMDSTFLTKATVSLASAVEASFPTLLPLVNSMGDGPGCTFCGMKLTQTIGDGATSMNIEVNIRGERMVLWIPLSYGICVLMNLIHAERLKIITGTKSSLGLQETLVEPNDIHLPKPPAQLEPILSGVHLDVDLFRRLHIAFTQRSTPNPNDVEAVWGPLLKTIQTPDRAIVSTALSLFCSIPRHTTMSVQVHVPASPSATKATSSNVINLVIPWDALQCESVESWLKTTTLATYSAYFACLMGTLPDISSRDNLPFSWMTLGNRHTLLINVFAQCRHTMPSSITLSKLVSGIVTSFVQTSHQIFKHMTGNDYKDLIHPMTFLPIALSITIDDEVPLIIITEKGTRVFFSSKQTKDRHTEGSLARVIFVFELAIRAWSCAIRNKTFHEEIPTFYEVIPSEKTTILPSAIQLGTPCTKFLLSLSSIVSLNHGHKMMTQFPEQDKTTGRAQLQQFNKVFNAIISMIKRLPIEDIIGPRIQSEPQVSSTSKKALILDKEMLHAIFTTPIPSRITEPQMDHFKDSEELLKCVLYQLKKTSVTHPCVICVHIQQQFTPGGTTDGLINYTVIAMDDTEEIQHQTLSGEPPKPHLDSSVSVTIVYAGSLDEHHKWVHGMAPIIISETGIPAMTSTQILQLSGLPESTLRISWNKTNKLISAQFVDISRVEETTLNEEIIAEAGVKKYTRMDRPFTFVARSEPVMLSVPND